MRVRDLEARLLRLGWTREAAMKPTVRWRSPSGRLLCYHVPHGTDARELPRRTAQAILRRVERIEGREAS